MVGARHLEHYDWTRAANGELTRVLSVDEHKEEEQTFVTRCATSFVVALVTLVTRCAGCHYNYITYKLII
jgi:hypothetical protein